ncbi:hypothetical protein J5289_18500 [Rhizobium sp. B230/85]|uniref:hypothetical protein n=1 Tax=unclassified Rhizobium TaxID=2613769 RepID=UPI001ADCF342|nr:MULTISPECIES: hypothetical protein [unclassified Rhizobium]MBO9136278.1 hypothetical protein [Rhizobium sp. B209b/85]QXZ98573.1 hypothetical protein J5289_18500 [Rhizobium sp. B230/85]
MRALVEVESFGYKGDLVETYFIPIHQICGIRKQSQWMLDSCGWYDGQCQANGVTVEDRFCGAQVSF